jgi:hypothetical protein
LLHLHFVRALDFDVEDGTPFLAMDHAANGALSPRQPAREQMGLRGGTRVAHLEGRRCLPGRCAARWMPTGATRPARAAATPGAREPARAEPALCLPAARLHPACGSSREPGISWLRRLAIRPCRMATGESVRCPPRDQTAKPEQRALAGMPNCVGVWPQAPAVAVGYLNSNGYRHSYIGNRLSRDQ